MNIKGTKYNFGRCLRISFSRYTANGINLNNAFVVEHAPELDRNKNIAIDVYVKDMPSASEKDQPGFMANVTIYNPSEKLISVIQRGAVWINNFESTEDYYKSRLNVSIEAGYVEGSDEKKHADYKQIIKGFVQGSALYRKGTEWVLTFGVYDIDINRVSSTIEKDYKNKTTEDYLKENYNIFANTWHETLIKYIKQYETYRIVENPKTTNLNVIGLPQSVQPSTRTKESMSFNQWPIQTVSDFDRNNASWFEIYYVPSLDEYYQSKRSFDPNNVNVSGARDIDLEQELKNTIMPEGGSVTGNNLDKILDGLCAVFGGLHWARDLVDVKKNRYIIWRGEPFNFVSGEKATIKIYNYQNLLESPIVSGNGMMTVKMIFNPDCKCLETIALMVDKNKYDEALGKKLGQTNSFKSTFQGAFMKSIAAQSSGLSTYGNIQVNGSNAVAALNKQYEMVSERGDLFNKGFPIISVEHRLSTYGKDWNTTIKTAPSISGFNIKKED